MNTYLKQKEHKLLTNQTKSEHLAFLYSSHNKERAQQTKPMQSKKSSSYLLKAIGQAVQKRGMIMRKKSSLWKTTAVSLSAMMTVSMGAAVWAANTEQTTQESQTENNTEDNTENNSLEDNNTEDTKNTENETAEPQSTDSDEASSTAEAQTEECKIELSDDGILVDGEAISENPEDAVYAGADIVYYKEGQDSTYGAGDEDDGHSEEEAAEHTVVTITKAGTYRVSGTLSKGQIAIDLGEDSRDDESAVVNLILDNADITCTVSSAIVVYNAYECGSDDTETATKDVDTTNAGVHIILADDSENTITGSHVAKIYKEGTTQEDVDAGNAKKQWKFDGAIESLVSIVFDAEEEGTGSLTVNSDNEGIETYLHLTVNGGNITINSADDGLNANEDGVSVITINGGVLTVNAGAGQEGDGIDSNGWIIINDGFIATAANATSPDSGVDSDNGIYINGGTLLASGNMYDEVSDDSEQTFVVLSFADSVEAGQMFALKNADGEVVTAFSAANDFQTLVYSSSELTDGDYTLYEISSAEGTEVSGLYTEVTSIEDETQLQYGSKNAGGFGGMGGAPMGGQRPDMQDGEAPSVSDGEMPSMPEGEAPSMPDGEMPSRPEGEAPDGQNGQAPNGQDGEAPSKPEGEAPDGQNGQAPNGQDGEAPSKPEGEAPDGQNGQQPDGQAPDMPQDGDDESGTVFTISGVSNTFSRISEVSATEEVESYEEVESSEEA